MSMCYGYDQWSMGIYEKYVVEECAEALAKYKSNVRKIVFDQDITVLKYSVPFS